MIICFEKGPLVIKTAENIISLNRDTLVEKIGGFSDFWSVKWKYLQIH